MRVLIFVTTLLMLVGLGACAPSPEQAATMTAAAWTPTPIPTPTATPVPYDLTVHVRDQSGAAVPGASIVIPESGSDQSRQADASGVLVWKGLAGPEATLKVSAPGHYAALQPVTLEPGETELVVILQVDPFALLPEAACAANEKLLYSEDFQNGTAKGWPNITAAVTLKAENGWSIVQQEDGNEVARFSGVFENEDDLQGYTFDNVVWRLKVEAHGQDGFSFLDFRHAPSAGVDTRYPVQWGASASTALTRMEMPGPGQVAVKTSGLRVKQDTWYYVEISDYQGQIQVWIDGKKLIDYTDPQPLPPGTIGLEVHILKDASTAYYFDDLSVCGLSGPFTTSLYNPTSP